MWRLRLAFALLIVLAPSLPSTGATESTRQDPTTLSRPAIVALQRRLTEAGCYKGPLDGAASLDLNTAVDACPDQRSVLRVETGMHLAGTRGLGVDAKCRLMATGSADKTVRLWSLPDGHPLRVIRWPIGEGIQGEVNAVAVSPDGRFVAVGGWDAQPVGAIAHGVSIFETASGAFVAHVGAAKKAIIRLSFSDDGRWLAFSSGGEGVRLIETAAWREVAADTAYGEGADVYGLAFGADGALYTAALDGTLRRYAPGPAFTKDKEVKLRGAKQALSVAVDPDGKRLAVGYYNKLVVDFYDAATLAYRGHADTRSFRDGDFGFLAWRADGKALIGGGLFGHGDTMETLLFDRDGRPIGAPAPVSRNSVAALRPCGAGFAFTALDPAVGLLDAQGKVVFSHTTVAADMRRKLDGLLAMPDGKTVRFGLGRHDANPVAFDLAKMTLKKSIVATVPYGSALTGGLPVKGWDSTFRPTFAGRPIELEPNELSRALAINHTPTGFVLGTSGYLRAYDEKGVLRWKVSAPGEAWGTIFSADDEVVIVAYTDGTIRWHRWSDGTELLALFVDKDTMGWVAWTPSGYYSASPGADDMIGRQINRGWRQTADFFPASTFRDTYNRPDVIERVIDTLDEQAALKAANAARPDGGRLAAKPPAPVTEALPPVIAIASPADGAAVGERVSLDYVVRSPSGVPLQSVQALVDGRPASGARGLARISELDALAKCLAGSEAPPQGCRGRLAVDVPPGRSEVGLVATAGGRKSEVARIRVTRDGLPAPAIAALKPKLYALVVGISAYRDKDYALAFPAKDARDFAAALANQKGGLYADVEVRTIVDGDATATAIRQGLDWLTKEVTSRDVGLVYLAGHGVLDERNRFYFLAADSDGAALRATAVPREDIADALDGLAGKALLFLDACHAGAIAGTSGRRDTVDLNAVVEDFAHSESGVVVFAASTGRQISQENDKWGNGAFTKAVVEGLGLPGIKARADFGSGAITTSELDAYVTERVKSLTGGAQSPVMIRPATVPDFPLAVAR